MEYFHGQKKVSEIGGSVMMMYGAQLIKRVRHHINILLEILINQVASNEIK